VFIANDWKHFLPNSKSTWLVKILLPVILVFKTFAGRTWSNWKNRLGKRKLRAVSNSKKWGFLESIKLLPVLISGNSWIAGQLMSWQWVKNNAVIVWPTDRHYCIAAIRLHYTQCWHSRSTENAGPENEGPKRWKNGKCRTENAGTICQR